MHEAARNDVEPIRVVRPPGRFRRRSARARHRVCVRKLPHGYDCDGDASVIEPDNVDVSRYESSNASAQDSIEYVRHSQPDVVRAITVDASCPKDQNTTDSEWQSSEGGCRISTTQVERQQLELLAQGLYGEQHLFRQ